MPIAMCRLLRQIATCRLHILQIAQANISHKYRKMEFEEYESYNGQYHPVSTYSSDIVDSGLNRAVKQQLSKLYTGVARDQNPLKLHYDAAQEDCLRRNAESHYNNQTNEIHTPPPLPGYAIPTSLSQVASPFVGSGITSKLSDENIFLQFMIFVLILLVIMQYTTLVSIEKTLQNSANRLPAIAPAAL